MSWASVLQPLREVPGVQGFLLLDDAGQVVARDLNSLYDDGMLQAVARRVMTLVEASKEILAGSEAWLLRFEAYAISIRRTASHVLLALTSHEANFAALGVAGRLILRRLGEQAAQRPAPPRPEPVPRAAPPVPAPSEPTPSAPIPPSPAVPRRSAPGSTSRASPRRRKLRRNKKGIWG